jgi:hypothetical protein
VEEVFGEFETEAGAGGDVEQSVSYYGRVAGGHGFDVVAFASEGALRFEEVLDGGGEVGVGIGEEQRAYIVEGDGCGVVWW